MQLIAAFDIVKFAFDIVKINFIFSLILILINW